MKPIPESENALVIRTDFSDDAAWESMCAAIQAPVGEFRAYVEFLNDPAYESITVEQLLSLNPKENGHFFVFVVDQVALTYPDQPILVIDLDEEAGRAFRVIPAEMWAVENNLSLANMDFFEFADAVDEDGVFRGFPIN